MRKLNTVSEDILWSILYNWRPINVVVWNCTVINLKEKFFPYAPGEARDHDAEELKDETPAAGMFARGLQNRVSFSLHV